jgi:hypothetical protein
MAGEWITVRVPFLDMVAVERAKTVDNAPPVDIRNLRSLQFMLSKFEYNGQLNPRFTAGRFSLSIESIGTY